MQNVYHTAKQSMNHTVLHEADVSGPALQTWHQESHITFHQQSVGGSDGLLRSSAIQLRGNKKYQTDRHPFNSLFSRTTWASWHQKG